MNTETITSNDLVPKVIHYVWLGGGKLTPSAKRCINSWRKIMPDYQIKCWDESNFDINSVPWVKEAIEKKKWSLASDYIRFYALYTEGGIYMDTDVMVFKPFTDFLKYDVFTSIECHPAIFNKEGVYDIDDDGFPLNNPVRGLGLLAALIGAKCGNLYIKECMDFFGNRHFIKEDGTLFIDIINPVIMPMIALKYGFRFKDCDQYLEKNIKIFSSSIFASDILLRTKESYSMHYSDNSWVEKTVFGKMKSYIKAYCLPFLKR